MKYSTSTIVLPYLLATAELTTAAAMKLVPAATGAAIAVGAIENAGSVDALSSRNLNIQYPLSLA
jgi:hypothetical protein